MTSYNRCSAILRKTIPPFAIKIQTSNVISTADDDAVFISLWDELRFSAAALSHAEKDVVKAVVLVYSRSFLNRKVGRSIGNNILDVVFATCPSEQFIVIVNFDLLDAGPVAAECEVARTVFRFLKDKGVDEVITTVLRQTNGAMICPGSGTEGL
jgi:hypothetical protein